MHKSEVILECLEDFAGNVSNFQNFGPCLLIVDIFKLLGVAPKIWRTTTTNVVLRRTTSMYAYSYDTTIKTLMLG